MKPLGERKLAKHHYQPAALIGGFSADSSRSLRERVVWVRRRGMSRAFYNSAENLGYVRDLYTLIENHGQPPDMATGHDRSRVARV